MTATTIRRWLHWTLSVPTIGVVLLALTWGPRTGAGAPCGRGPLPDRLDPRGGSSRRGRRPPRWRALRSLVLAVAVTVIEVALIVTLMIGGKGDTSTLARDTVFSAVMLTMNGIVGISLLVAASKHHLAVFNAEGAGSALATVITLATLTLVLPRFTTTEPGPVFSAGQLAFAALAWPVACTAIGRRSWWANFTASATSVVVAAPTTTSG